MDTGVSKWRISVRGKKWYPISLELVDAALNNVLFRQNDTLINFVTKKFLSFN